MLSTPTALRTWRRGSRRSRERGGRLFILGVGGSAGHASHAVNDFRKICDIEAYTPTDNVSELTARVNDEGWDTTFAEWLRGSRLSAADALLIFSVGGGDEAKACRREYRCRAAVGDRAGRADLRHRRPRRRHHRAARHGRVSSSRRSIADHITPHTEGLCAVIWHLLVTHPALARWRPAGSH